MKLSFYSLLIVSVFSLAACGDDEDTILNNENIVGTWNLTMYDADAEISFGLGGVVAETTQSTSTLTESTVKITFNADGTWTSEGDLTITTTVDGMMETSEQSDGVGSGTYIVADGRLTMSDLDAGDEADVSDIEFDTNYTPDTRIEMNGTTTESDTDPLLGLEFTIDLDLSMVLER
ncbi:MAG: hypothetical protein AAGJ93_15545 [Bacteroidota bacterium]